jgi:hypothetical protein
MGSALGLSGAAAMLTALPFSGTKVLKFRIGINIMNSSDR